MNLTDFCTQLAQQLDATPESDLAGKASRALQGAFKVASDEVAIFRFDPKMEVFHFSWPPALKSAGVVPLQANNSLVARTGRDRRGYLDNHFSKSAHVFIFEYVQGQGDNSEQRRPIQKIMSAPLQSDGQLCGVIQVSRKGIDARDAGADFTRNELAALEKIAGVIAGRL